MQTQYILVVILFCDCWITAERRSALQLRDITAENYIRYYRKTVNIFIENSTNGLIWRIFFDKRGEFV
ncbi:MAG: hypothetical protein B6244_06460 [Candidatus Cloacimonetes bacterium 4572_55]|nr:MAG: hypothetical protein B6244_06460 [Candidatus Cloacimonetes bacterium 4572_55]